jgi:zinc protease
MTRRTLLAITAAAAMADERKNRAPISRDALVVKLPEAAPVKLSNGITVLALEDNRLPLVYARLQMEGTGPIFSSRAGLAELTASQLAEGAGSRSGKQILEASTRWGGRINSSTSPGAETSIVDGTGLSTHFPDWLRLMADVLVQPQFPADEFDIMRQRLRSQLRMRGAQPASVADDACQRVTYGNHPAARGYPNPAELAALSADQAVAWYRERYAPASTVATVIGRVRPSKVVSLLEEAFGSWKKPEPSIALPPAPRPARERRVILIDRPGAAQTELALGGLTFDRRDPDFFSFSLANLILGANSGNSRLIKVLRGDKGYAFNASSNFSAPRFPGFWRVRAGVRTDVTGDALATIVEILERLCSEPVSTQELDDAKGAYVGQFARALEQPQTVINYSYLRFRYGFSPDYWERVPAKVMAVTPSEIQAVAQKYLNPAHAHIVAVGDASKIRSALAKFGSVEMQEV